MDNTKVLFRIPLTIYYLCWDKDKRLLKLATKKYDSGREDCPWYFHYIN